MIYDLQRAGIGKRFSAFLFDFVIMLTLVVGVAFVISSVLDYDSKSDRVEEIRKEYAERYDVDLDIKNEDYEKLSEEEKQKYQDVQDAYAQDEEVVDLYAMMLNYILIIISLSPLIGFLILEFTVPMLFKNGQTLGKKIFGIGVVLKGGIRINGVALFTRSILGKFAIETAIPIICFIMMLFTHFGALGGLIIFALLIANLILFMGKNHTVIHDLLAYTVCVELSSQMIFESEEELAAYKNRVHEELNDKGGAEY